MQAIAETLFDIVYLTTVITLGVRMIRGCKGNPQFRLFGIMAVVLGIYRNIPFALLGLVIIVLFYRSAREHQDAAFRWMWLTITLSFGFYIPVVLWADTIPLMGMLMIPKTCAYVWTVSIGYRAMKKECR